ncbi:MAG: Extracellular exo-alpha-L-arabinofuranosidase precursor [Bacteroidetes bacterium]|nr:Extracellular exo-alpha-L-arabinofuranosidase precursor [Bacteroidota bacterium]
MNTKFTGIALLLTCLLISNSSFQLLAQKSSSAKITVDVNKPGHAISPTLFGVFFEDINLSADGGLYPELIRNRSFEDADTLQNWKFSSGNAKTSAKITTADVHSRPPVPPLNPYNRKSLFVNFDGSFKLENGGYWGIYVVQGEKYAFKLAARAVDGLKTPLKVSVVGEKGNIIASSEISGITSEWKYYPLAFTASASDTNAHLEISGNGNGKLYLDMVSLIPEQTWKKSGLRTDLSEAMNALKPTFLRFPGGCWVEGDDFAHMNNWKKTIGNVDTRTPLWNIWGYNATHGLGYHEYLQMAEDLGAEPLYCVNAGISHKEVVPMDQMGQWIQDALDAIEYANGPVASVWGGIRAKNGHPSPFNLKYLEIGNENGMAPYAERWAWFVRAIHNKYPDIVLIANEWAGSHPKNPKPQIVDEHYYNNPEWFIWNSNKYDSYDRNGSKIFVGEYAVTSGTGNGNLRGAIGEAAWMTGLERNSDVVVMAAYAPLFCHAKHKAWPVNLINFDNHRWFGIPSYYVQQLFAANQGTVNLPASIESAPAIEMPRSKGAIGLGTWLNSAEFKDLEVTDTAGKILLKPDFNSVESKWRKTPNSEWSAKDGVLRQSAISANTTIYMGDTTWTDYTIKLKARKIEGENGFQIYFHNKGPERTRWDIGGFTNSVNILEVGLVTESMDSNVQPGRWYDVRIEIRGTSVKAYLDGKLTQEVSADNLKVKGITTSASKDDKTGDIILKVVNVTAKGIKTDILLKGATELTGTGTATVLTSLKPTDENTLDNPTKVSPKTENVKFSGTKITRLFPANSLTVMRLSTKNK